VRCVIFCSCSSEARVFAAAANTERGQVAVEGWTIQLTFIAVEQAELPAPFISHSHLRNRLLPHLECAALVVRLWRLYTLMPELRVMPSGGNAVTTKGSPSTQHYGADCKRRD
jgi:hypothetical protein